MCPFTCPPYIFLRVTWLFRSLDVLVNTARWNTSLHACIWSEFSFCFLLPVVKTSYEPKKPRATDAFTSVGFSTNSRLISHDVGHGPVWLKEPAKYHCTVERKFAIILTVALFLVLTPRRNFSLWYQYFFNLIVSPDIPTKDREFCRLGALQYARW